MKNVSLVATRDSCGNQCRGRNNSTRCNFSSDFLTLRGRENILWTNDFWNDILLLSILLFPTNGLSIFLYDLYESFITYVFKLWIHRIIEIIYQRKLIYLDLTFSKEDSFKFQFLRSRELLSILIVLNNICIKCIANKVRDQKNIQKIIISENKKENYRK